MPYRRHIYCSDSLIGSDIYKNKSVFFFSDERAEKDKSENRDSTLVIKRQLETALPNCIRLWSSWKEKGEGGDSRHGTLTDVGGHVQGVFELVRKNL